MKERNTFGTMEKIVQLHVKLLKKGNNVPLKGEAYKVKFFDKDLIEDDFLGESTLDDFGHAIISVRRSNFRSIDSPLEKYPDIYFTVLKDGQEIFKSPVGKNLHIEESSDFPASGGSHFHLGSFIV